MSEVFKAYERVKTERVEVATITEDNIHLIAKEVGGTVDYSGMSLVFSQRVSLISGGRWDGRFRYSETV